MLTEAQLMVKMEDMAHSFNQLVKRRDYVKAKYLYDTARNVAVAVELPPETMEKLFGIRGPKGEEIQKGLFPEELVQKVVYITTIKKT